MVLANCSILFAETAKLTQNSYIERFNRTCREEVLDLYVFTRLSEVKEITDDWIEQYNQERPHESLNNLTPLDASIDSFVRQGIYGLG